MSIMKRISQVNSFLETNRILPWLVWLLYVVLLCIVSYYHEPWHDEGQAWLIARDDSLWHLLTYTTHLEGHPPLWFMCLMPFAKMGMPFELGLKTVNIFFCSAAMFILIKKSPLSWYWRFFLPFSYFLFYQFGVVNRTYSLLMFAMMLAAYFYSQKNDKPFQLAGALILLSGSQAYGMMIACGVACAWFVDIVCDTKKDSGIICLHNLLKNSGCRALILLFLVALSFALTMIPLQETAFTNLEITRRGVFWENLFFCLSVMPAQLFCNLDIKDTIYDQSFAFFAMNLRNYWGLAKDYGIYAYVLVAESLLKYLYGPLVQVVLGYICYFMGLELVFLLPEIFFFILASLVFLRPHHIGILACFYIFIIWQIYAQPMERIKKCQESFENKFTNVHEYWLVKVIIYGILAGIFVINFEWSLKDARADIKVPYDCSREVANFIKINGMQDLKIWVPWKYVENNTKVAMGSYAINPYFKKPFIENMNGGFTPYGFLEYKIWDKDKFEANLKKMGQPDCYLDDTPVDKVFNKSVEYVPVQRFEYYKMHKQHVESGYSILFLRKHLLVKYPQLHELTKKEMQAPLKYFSE